MTIQDVEIEVRLPGEQRGKTLGFADAVLTVGHGSTVRLNGFRVLQSNGEGRWVAPASRKGSSKFFRFFELSGPIKQLVEEMILKEYDIAIGAKANR